MVLSAATINGIRPDSQESTTLEARQYLSGKVVGL
jgi:hypothetical protein